MPNFFLAYSAQFLLTTMVRDVYTISIYVPAMVYQYVSSVSIHIPSITDIIIHYHIFVGIGTFFFYQKRQTFKKKKSKHKNPHNMADPLCLDHDGHFMDNSTADFLKLSQSPATSITQTPLTTTSSDQKSSESSKRNKYHWNFFNFYNSPSIPETSEDEDRSSPNGELNSSITYLIFVFSS